MESRTRYMETQAGATGLKAASIRYLSLISISSNGMLALLKMLAGLHGNSLTLIGDGLDSIADTISGVIALFTAKLLLQPPDAKHPWGYGRAEAIATKVMSMLMIFGALQLLLAAGKQLDSDFGWFSDRTIHQELPSLIALYISAISVPIKLLLAFFQYRIGKKIDSKMLAVDARNMFNDSILSISVLLGLVLTLWIQSPVLEHLFGLGVALWVLYSGVQIFLESSRDLMDGCEGMGLYHLVFEAVSDVKELREPHRLRIRKIGNLYEVIFDVMAPASLRLDEAHILIERAESAIRKRIPDIFDIIVHLEPSDISTEHQEKEGFGMSPEALEMFESYR